MFKLVDHEPEQVRRTGSGVDPSGKLPVLNGSPGYVEIVSKFLLTPAGHGSQLFDGIIHLLSPPVIL